MKTTEIAKRLGVSTNTIRNWCKEYATFLSADAKVSGSGTVRHFSDRDALILATISDLRNKGLPHEQISKALAENRLVETLPGAATPEEEHVRRNLALVPLAQLQRALDQMQVLQGEIERLTHERDRALAAREADTQKYTERIADLNRELGRARGLLIGSSVAFALLALSFLVLIGVIVTLWRYLPQP